VPGLGEWTSAIGSMNHVAFDVPEQKFLEYRAKLKAKGVRVSPVIDHDDSEFGVAAELHPGVFVRSFYFQDPDGILLEFASWRRVMGQPGDVRHEPKTAADRAVRI
jgi:catechol 2,3-dioxygenase-like lactoylglutathione lyase family enzyme